MGTITDIRTAGQFDCGRLADFRIRFVQNRFQGYIPSDSLIRLDRDAVKHELQQWQKQGWTLDYICENGEICGLMVYWIDREKAESWIELVEILTPAVAEHKIALVNHAVANMRQLGCARVYLWLLKDNFRARFLFEHYGFRRDSETRTVNRNGYSLLQVRYSYAISAKTEA